MNKEKKNPSPSPGSYNPKKKERQLGGAIVKSDIGGFIDDAKWQSSQTPGHTYNAVEMDKVRGKARIAKILTQTKEDIRFQKLVKKDGPDPGSYEPLDAFTRSKANKTSSFMFGKGPSYLDVAVKSKNHIPPPG